jgi:hypothetical protein
LVSITHAGPLSAKKYDSFVGSSQRQTFGPGDVTYLYPAGQRSYDATGNEGSEHAPFTSSSKDSVELATPMSVTFELNTDERTIRTFHEQIGIKYKAYYDDGSDDISKGWMNMLNFYMGQSLDTTVDRVLAGFNWRQAYNDPAVRVLIQTEIQKDLPQLVSQKMGGQYFTNYAVQVQRPVPTNQQLKDNIASAQNQVALAEAARGKADADLATAQAQVAVQQAEANKKKADISAYGSVEEYIQSTSHRKGNQSLPAHVHR